MTLRQRFTSANLVRRVPRRNHPKGTLVAALALIVAGCGHLPGGAVAVVDGEPIERAEFAHWLDVTTRWSRQPDDVAPDPDSGFSHCIAVKRNAARTAASDAELKRRCEQDYRVLRDEVLRVLISMKWLEHEARAMKLTISDAEVRRALDAQIQQTFLRRQDYREFLARTHTTESDMLVSARLAVLGKRVYAHALERDNRVSPREIEQFYVRNKGRFHQPEKRDLRVVVARTKRAAERARATLASGAAWPGVVARYSIDDVTKASAGALPDQAQGMLEFELDEAVFSAREGELVGPIKASEGYYVFSVTRIAKAGQQNLADAKATIAQLLRSERQHDVLERFDKDFRRRWRTKTTCAAGYVTDQCVNGT
jgi:foldase protein PrsA